MLGLTKKEYIKQQRAKENEALKNAPIEMDSQYKKGGMTASKRADGIAQRGKTKGRIC
jgi:hypothetical protein